MVHKLKHVLQGTKRVNLRTTEYKQVKGSSYSGLPFLCVKLLHGGIFYLHWEAINYFKMVVKQAY